MSQLRKALGRDTIVTQAPGYLVQRRAGRARFRALRAARPGSTRQRTRRRRRAAARGTRALARPAARRSRRFDRPARAGRARGPPRRDARAADRRRPRARSPRGGRLRAGGSRPGGSAARAPSGAADARALPLGPAGRGPRYVSQRQEAPRRRARPRAGRRAAPAREGDPGAGSGDRRTRSRRQRAERTPEDAAGALEPLSVGGRDSARSCSQERCRASFSPSPAARKQSRSCRTRSRSVDPKTGRIAADVPIGGQPVAIALGGRSLLGRERRRPDASSESTRKARTVEDTRSAGWEPIVSDLAFGFGSVWVAGGNDGTLMRIDPVPEAPEAPIDLGKIDELCAAARLPGGDRRRERLDHARQQGPADRPRDRRGSNQDQRVPAAGPRGRCGSRLGDDSRTSTCCASTRHREKNGRRGSLGATVLPAPSTATLSG